MKIYHNPRCSKSRQTLELIQQAGQQVEIIDYLNQPPSEKELTTIIKLLGINAEDLVYVGVRDTEAGEEFVLEKLGIKSILVEELRKVGVDKTIETINDKLKDCDIIYVSFDVDSMDPNLTSHGTGTPVPNGITPNEAMNLLTQLAANPKTCCMDVVEVNPCVDEKKNKMAEVEWRVAKNN